MLNVVLAMNNDQVWLGLVGSMSSVAWQPAFLVTW